MKERLILDKRNRYNLIRESLIVSACLTVLFAGYAAIRFDLNQSVIITMIAATIGYVVFLWRLSEENTLGVTRFLMVLVGFYVILGLILFGSFDNNILFFSAAFHTVAINLLLNFRSALTAAVVYLAVIAAEISGALFSLPFKPLEYMLPNGPIAGGDTLYVSVFCLLAYIIVRGLSVALKDTRHTSEALADANAQLQANEQRLQSILHERTRELQESEEKNRAIVDALPDVMSRTTIDGIYTDFRVPSDFPNREVVDVDRVGRSFYEFIPEEQADYFVDMVERAIETGQRVTYEFTSKQAGLSIEARVTKLNDREVISILRDVTAQRQAEQQLRQSEARNRALVSAIPDVMVRLTRSGEYLDFVLPDDFPMAQRVVKERAGSHLNDHFSAELAGRLLQGIGAAIDNNSMVRVEYERPELNMWFEARIMPTHADEATVIVRDITRQKIDSRRLQAIINSIPNAVVIWSKKVEWSVLWANQIAGQMFDIPFKESIGETWDLTSYITDPHVGAEFIGKLSRQDPILNRDVQLNIPNGIPSWYRMSIIHLNYAGSTAFMLIAEDVNEQRRSNEILQRVQKLDSLGVLAGGIAHDFNNLLTSIIAQTSIAQRKLEGGHDIRAHLDKSLTASKKASGLIQQMLAFSGRGQFEIREINLAEIVEENLSFLHASLPKAAEITFEPVEQPAFISADSSQVQQVLMNLILNSAQAIESSHKGEIKIKIEHVHHSGGLVEGGYTAASLEEGAYASLTVCDNGSGMDAETQNRIFEPFFTTKATGHGLGLAAVVGIMRGHSGEIIVHSTLGSGTEVQLLFPLVERQAGKETLSLNVPTQVNNAGAYVLAIDDEPYILDVIEDALMLIEQPVLLAQGGKQGIQLFEENRHRIGLVVLDLSMPDMDGSDVFVKLREIQPDIPVILCSGYSELEATRKFVGQGLAGFLQKPFELNRLMTMVSEFSKQAHL